MKPILFVTSNVHTLEVCSQVLASGEFADILLISCVPFKTKDEILDAVASYGAEVIIARGSLADFLEEHLPITIVKLPTTPFNLLSCMESARQYGPAVSIIASRETLFGAEKLGLLMGMHVTTYPLDRYDDPKKVVAKAIASGTHSIIAGNQVLEDAAPVSCPAIPFAVDETSVLQSIDEARRISLALAAEKQRKNLMQAFLKHSNGGIIAVDTHSRIFLFNPDAQRMLQISESQAIGKKLDDICPAITMEPVIETGQSESSVFFSLRGANYLCDKVAVHVDGSVVGALAFIQNVTTLQHAEAAVRRKIADTGLLADKTFDDIIGESAAIRRAVDNAKGFAITDYSVLLLGETGTGKELFAQSIHNYSKRSRGPFVAVNCAALPPDLLESELFGYEAGAFTGARSKGKPGMFELAHGGTLFLDEIAEMSMQTQSKFLRALQERKIMRLGGDRVLPVDVRLITATNKNLFECIAEGKFRQDLYYRMNVLKLLLPPLRTRPDDVALQAKQFLKHHAAKGGPALQLTPGAVHALQQHNWPGNVRELLNFMERLVAMYGNQGAISKTIIESLLAEEQIMVSAPAMVSVPAAEDDLAEIHRVLAATNGNYTQAARILGLSRVTLWRKLKRNSRPAKADKKG